jgi:hypothetical protein
MPKRRAKTPCQRQGAEQSAEDPEGIAGVKQRMFRPLRIVAQLSHAAADADIAGARKASDQHRDPIRDVVAQGDAVTGLAARTRSEGRSASSACSWWRRWARPRQLAATGDLDDRSAEKLVGGSDAAQADCSKRFCGVDHELPTQYNLVLESETVALENAAT